jgi:DNA-binding GntR family transcriptional regulator
VTQIRRPSSPQARTGRALVPWLASRIVEHLRESGHVPGAHVTEQALADHFRVSRTPVRMALAHLAELGAVEHRPNRGFHVVAPPSAITTAEVPDVAEDELYYRIAEDRLAGHVSERVTESELARRYRASRRRIHGLMARMAQEGWLQRLPGHGWVFQPMLDSVAAYAEAFRFRAIIEPAALREKGYRLAPEAIAGCRSQQADLLERTDRFTDAEIFRIGSSFHETLVSGAGNALLLDAIRRVNGLRRLMEYRAKRDRRHVPQQCREHLRLLDLIEKGDLEGAAVQLEKHLKAARARKSPLVA